MKLKDCVVVVAVWLVLCLCAGGMVGACAHWLAVS